MKDQHPRNEHESPVPAGAPAGGGQPPYPGNQPQQGQWTPAQGAPGPSTHRYGNASGHGAGPGAGYDTARYDTRAWGSGPGTPGGPPYFGGPAPQDSPPAGRPHRTFGGGLVAAVLAGALVVGGAAGLGGAAVYDVLNGESSTPTSSAVVATKDTPAKAGSIQAVAGTVLPSVVKINVRGAQGAGSGSGVILSSDGEILTNYHVVELAGNGGAVSVSFANGKTVPANIVGTDPLTDLAIIKAEGVSGLKPATLGKSGNLDVGEQVVAIGSPFGLESTVTSGIVSALNRPVSISGQGSIDTAYPAIQTDAAINPGNSGGPLVNMQGQVVGINSSIRSVSSATSGEAGSIGLGFAIPLDEAMPIVDQLKNGQTPTHARLGVSVTDATGDNGLVAGAGVADVSAGTAAEQAGLKRGDVVLKVDDEPVQNATSLVATVRGHRPGDTVTLTVDRGGKQIQVQATLGSDKGSPTS